MVNDVNEKTLTRRNLLRYCLAGAGVLVIGGASYWFIQDVSRWPREGGQEQLPNGARQQKTDSLELIANTEESRISFEQFFDNTVEKRLGERLHDVNLKYRSISSRELEKAINRVLPEITPIKNGYFIPDSRVLALSERGNRVLVRVKKIGNYLIRNRQWETVQYTDARVISPDGAKVLILNGEKEVAIAFAARDSATAFPVNEADDLYCSLACSGDGSRIAYLERTSGEIILDIVGIQNWQKKQVHLFPARSGEVVGRNIDCEDRRIDYPYLTLDENGNRACFVRNDTGEGYVVDIANRTISIIPPLVTNIALIPGGIAYARNNMLYVKKSSQDKELEVGMRAEIKGLSKLVSLSDGMLVVLGSSGFHEIGPDFKQYRAVTLTPRGNGKVGRITAISENAIGVSGEYNGQKGCFILPAQLK